MTAILVLGAADGAIGPLHAARFLGLWAICADARADAPAVGAADELVNLSTRDVDGLARVMASRADLGGVISPASDVNLPTQFALARRLGLPTGLSSAAVRASVDKGFFRAVCDGLGLPGPRYVQGPAADLAGVAAALGPHVMVKPTDSSGSRGVARVEDPTRLPAALAHAQTYSHTRIVIAEEYLTGRHFTAEAVVVDGRVAVVGVTERQLTAPPHYVTVEHRMPGGGSALDAEVRTMLDAMCAAMDYAWGAVNLDLIVTDDGRVVPVEWGARLGGNGVAELVQLTTGVDATAWYVRMALGERPSLGELAPRYRQHAGFRVLGVPHSGRLTAIEGVDEARSVPGIASVVVAARPGDTVVPYTRAGAKVGYLLAAGPDREAVTASLDKAEELIRFVVRGPA